METQAHRLTVRLSAEMVAALKQLAQAHRRSLNGEIEWALRAYLAHQQKQLREGKE
jgi:predicted transcriptional regulator